MVLNKEMFLPNTHLPPGRFGLAGNVEDDPEELAERLRKTLYYGKPPTTDRPSLPLTGLAVDYFQDVAPKELGKLDTYFAASASRSACMSSSSVMAGMLYTNRLRKKNPTYLQQVSSSDLFLISMMMASKFMYDEGVDEEVFNDEWAEAGNMDVEDINQLEREFLSAIDWELFVRPEEFSEMLHMIEKRIALQQGVDRGWFSYCDLWVLSQGANILPWSHLTADLSKVIAVSSLAYLASILTMIGSTILASTLSTGLISLGSTLVVPPTETPISVPALPNLEESETVPEYSSVISEIEASSIESVLTMADTNAAGLVDRITDNESNNSSVGTEYSEYGRSKSTLNNLLPPLLALVSLKDSFISFVNALRDSGTKNFDALRDSGTKNFDSRSFDQNFDHICSTGPCQQETWPHCWNTSDDYDESLDLTGSWCYDSDYSVKTSSGRDFGKPCQNCGARIKKGCSASELPRKCAIQTGTVHCCCSVKGHESLMDRVDWPAFSELSALGFMTGHAYPIFVTT